MGKNGAITLLSPVSDHMIWEDDIKEGIVFVSVSLMLFDELHVWNLTS